jgi:hypothetical protein
LAHQTAKQCCRRNDDAPSVIDDLPPAFEIREAELALLEMHIGDIVSAFAGEDD